MTTMTETRRSVKPVQSAHGTGSMQIRINGQAYSVKPMVACTDGEKGYWLRKLDGGTTRYACVQHPDGSCSCECADWEFKRHDTGTFCKHLAFLVTFGMLAGEGGVR